MARHVEFAHLFGEGASAEAGQPWQRGSDERTNGHLRRCFPEATDLRVHPAEHLAAVALRPDTRPRGILACRTPARVLAARPRS